MNRIRLLVVAVAALAAVAVWAVAEFVAGTDLRAPAFDGSSGTTDLALGQVLASAVLAALAGWGSLALLERLTRRARPLWIALAAVAFVVSLGGPMSGTGVSMANRWWLLAMHVAVAAVLVPGLPSARRRQPVLDTQPQSLPV